MRCCSKNNLGICLLIFLLLLYFVIQYFPILKSIKAYNMNPITTKIEPFSDEPWQAGGDMTHYWDCCKESCAWKDSPFVVNSCNKTGTNPSKTGKDATSVCDPNGTIATCTNRYPWIKDNILYGYVAGPNNGKAPCGTCYELELSNAKTGVKKAFVQQTSFGNVNGIFDFAVPGGGFGDFNGCKSMDGWKVYKSQGGPCDPSTDTPNCTRYGGFHNIGLCDTAFPGDNDAKAACKNILFGLFPDNTGAQYPDNITVSRFRGIECPVELTKNTGIGAPPIPPPKPGDYCNEDCGDCSWVNEDACSHPEKCGIDHCYTTCCNKKGFDCLDWCKGIGPDPPPGPGPIPVTPIIPKSPLGPGGKQWPSIPIDPKPKPTPLGPGGEQWPSTSQLGPPSPQPNVLSLIENILPLTIASVLLGFIILR